MRCPTFIVGNILKVIRWGGPMIMGYVNYYRAMIIALDGFVIAPGLLGLWIDGSYCGFCVVFIASYSTHG